MADNKKYYYLKLKDNFYDSEQMIILQNMQDGYLYSDILMKLYLRSLKSDGKLMFNNMIPYTPQVLAQVVRHQVGTVEKALQIFKELGLIEVLDNGAIYMMDIQNFIGKSSTEADRQREYYKKIKSDENGCKISYKKSTPEIEIEIEKEIEIEQEQEKETLVDLLQENGFVLSSIHYEIISQWEDNELTRYAIKQAVINNKYNIKYIDSIINSYKKENITTVQQAIERNEQFKDKKDKYLKHKYDIKETRREREERLIQEWLEKDE